MKNGRKLIILVISLFVLGMTGCGKGENNASSYKTCTFSVETGDSIELKLDRSDQYDISSELPFAISSDGNVLSQGMFITAEYYAQYEDVVNTDEKAILLDSGTKDGNTYFMWMYNNEEYNYAILIGQSDTGIILGNNVSEESARECFRRLTIRVKE